MKDRPCHDPRSYELTGRPFAMGAPTKPHRPRLYRGLCQALERMRQVFCAPTASLVVAGSGTTGHGWPLRTWSTPRQVLS